MTTSYNPLNNTPIIQIGTDAMRKHMGEILDCVNLRGNEFIIERKNKPLAVLIPPQKYTALREMARKYVLEILSHKTNDLSEDQADALADEAKHWARRKK